MLRKILGIGLLCYFSTTYYLLRISGEEHTVLPFRPDFLRIGSVFCGTAIAVPYIWYRMLLMCVTSAPPDGLPL